MLRFLRFIETSAPGTLTEIDAAKKLEALRADTAAEGDMPLADISFESISSTGPNGAINHYRVTERTNRRLEDGELYLIDSGGQYRDGTTDITRTLPIGTPPRERLDLFRDRFTRVLRGHIAIATARFPKGTTGAQLDTLARVALWQAGLDFDHGTGHGVGSYLSVHEGPQRISKTGHTPLEAGMIISNEPGYYKAGDFGIRIENLVVVRDAEDVPGGDRPMHSFETVSLAPIDRRLIEPLLMTPAEIAWLDSYHQRVFGTLSGGRASPRRSGNGSPRRAGRSWARWPSRSTRYPPTRVNHASSSITSTPSSAAFLSFEAGAGAGDHEVGLGGDRARHLGAEALGHRLRLVARHANERAGEHHRLAGDRRVGGDRLHGAHLHLGEQPVELLLVMLLVEELHDRLRHDRADPLDAVDLGKRRSVALGRRGRDVARARRNSRSGGRAAARSSRRYGGCRGRG